MRKIHILILLLFSAMLLPAQEATDTIGLMANVMKKLEQKSRFIPTVNGVLQAGYVGKYEPQGVDHQYSNTFTLNTARLNIKGSPADWFNYNLQVDFANGPRILDLNLHFHPLTTLKLKSQYLNIWLGQSKPPLTLEVAYGPAAFEAVTYSQAILNLCGYNQTLTPELTHVAGGRDIGLALYGSALKVGWGGEDHDFFEYKIGVYNGSGMNCKDQDNMKDVSGSLYLHPLKAMTLGGSFYIGAYKMEFESTSGTVKRQTRRDRWAASFRYDDNAHWMARAEYIGGKTHTQYTDGWYAALQYTINPNKEKKNQWALLAKYDGYRENYKRTPDVISHTAMLGINYRPVSWLYLQGNYSCRVNTPQKGAYIALHQAQFTACLIY